MNGRAPKSRSVRRRLVLHGFCLACFDAEGLVRRSFTAARIRVGGLNLGEFERCPNRRMVWHRRSGAGVHG